MLVALSPASSHCVHVVKNRGGDKASMLADKTMQSAIMVMNHSVHVAVKIMCKFACYWYLFRNGCNMNLNADLDFITWK